uniref:Gluconokinase n=1 Tax=Kalanchoe fedtschenkoi TaxID=63787 RepID=A0A7N1A5Y9_KALFE
MAVVLMGVTGAGKSTVGQKLAEAMSCTFLDADDFHSQHNKEKMRRGVPLTEEDRLPWLETLQGMLRKNLANGQPVVLGCSALKKGYREVLRSAADGYKPGSFTGEVKFVLLEAKAEVLEARLLKRLAEGKHFMPVTLLQSQLDTLQIDESEGILKVDATLCPDSIVNVIQASHMLEQADVYS